MDNILKILQDIVGEENATDDEFVRLAYSRDQNWNFNPPRMPDYVVRPANKNEVQAVLRLANRYRIPVIPIGGNLNVRGMTIPSEGGISLDLRRMKKVEVHEDMRAVTLEAGVLAGELAVEVDKQTEGRMRPILTSAPATAGACSNYMLRGLYYKQTAYGNDHILSAEVVLPNGEFLNTGSNAFPHSPGPYFRGWGSDITGLFMGQPGTMGVITSITVPLIDAPEIQDWCVVGYDTIDDAVKVGFKLQEKLMMQTNMWILDWLAYGMFYAIDRLDIPKFKGAFGDWTILFGLEGDERRVAIDREIAENILKDPDMPEYVAGGEIFPIPRDQKREQFYARDIYGFFKYGNYYACAFYAPLTKAPEYWRMGRELWLKHGLDIEKYGYAMIPFGKAPGVWPGQLSYQEPESFYYSADPEEAEPLVAFDREFKENVFKMGIYGWFRPYGGVMDLTLPGLGMYGEIWKNIKKMIDPNNIMNPGKCFQF